MRGSPEPMPRRKNPRLSSRFVVRGVSAPSCGERPPADDGGDSRPVASMDGGPFVPEPTPYRKKPLRWRRLVVRGVSAGDIVGSGVWAGDIPADDGDRTSMESPKGAAGAASSGLSGRASSARRALPSVPEPTPYRKKPFF
ncbi:histone methylation protein DOT1 [Aureococcus anophagefferens]|nr:histone methylation protein DOT1 [Aureococcus anophagefferens]